MKKTIEQIRQEAQQYTHDMDKNTDARAKTSTKLHFYYQTPEGKAFRERKRKIQSKNNKEKFGKGKYIVRSPGNDLLDFYDRMNDKLGKGRKSVIPPSVIFKIRYRTKMPKTSPGNNQYNTTRGPKHITEEICKPYYQTDDPSYWWKVYANGMKWLVDKPHKQWTFTYRKDAEKFLLENVVPNKKSIGINLSNTNSKWSGKNIRSESDLAVSCHRIQING